MTPIYPIRMLRLMTGETLVAGIAKSGKNSYILEKPMLMSVVAVQPEIDDASVISAIENGFVVANSTGEVEGWRLAGGGDAESKV